MAERRRDGGWVAHNGTAVTETRGRRTGGALRGHPDLTVVYTVRASYSLRIWVESVNYA